MQTRSRVFGSVRVDAQVEPHVMVVPRAHAAWRSLWYGVPQVDHVWCEYLEDDSKLKGRHVSWHGRLHPDEEDTEPVIERTND